MFESYENTYFFIEWKFINYGVIHKKIFLAIAFSNVQIVQFFNIFRKHILCIYII